MMAIQRNAIMLYSRWLVAGLTFQLAADIVSTSVAPGWEEIGKLAAVAAIRTFLNHFLERDQSEMRALRRSGAKTTGPEKKPHEDAIWGGLSGRPADGGARRRSFLMDGMSKPDEPGGEAARPHSFPAKLRSRSLTAARVFSEGIMLKQKD